HNIYPEMSFPALSMSGVPGVLVGFVDHLHARRGESLGQLLGDDIASCHGLGIAGAGPVGQSGEIVRPGQASAVVRRRGKLEPPPSTLTRSMVPGGSRRKLSPILRAARSVTVMLSICIPMIASGPETDS